jgi:hypothetical protein
LFLGIRNFIVTSAGEIFFALFCYRDVIAEPYLRVTYTAPWFGRGYAKISINGRVHFARINKATILARDFSITRHSLTLSPPDQYDNPVLTEMFWTWAVSGDEALGNLLETAITFAGLSRQNITRSELLARAISRVQTALGGLVGSSPNYRALYDYLDLVSLHTAGNTTSLREAVNAPLVVGGRK